MDYFTQLIVVVEHFPMYSYFIIAVFAFFDAFAFIGVLVPGGIAVVIGGFLVAQGILNAWYLLVIVISAVIFGDGLSFYLGKKGFIVFREKNRVFKPALLERGKRFFARHGGKSIFFGRFVRWARSITPFIAGVFNVNTRIFIFWSVLSGVLWAIAHIALGYFFGYTWTTMTFWSVRASIFVGVLFGIALIFYGFDWLIVRRGRRFFRFCASLSKSIVRAIYENEDVQHLVAKNERFFSFFSARLNRHSFWGLPTTFLSLAFVYVLSLFIGIVEDILSSDFIISVDMRIDHLLMIFRNEDLTQFFLWVTILGKWHVVLVFAIVTVGALFVWRRQFYVMPLIVTIVGSSVFTTLGKLAFQRVRPDTAVYFESSFSFPSGHATLAMAFYGFIVYILMRWVRSWKGKVNIFFAGMALIGLIGFSRIYLGVHYFSDVWGGYLVGALWLIIGISIAEWWHAQKQTIKPLMRRWQSLVISLLIGMLAVLFYVAYGMQYHPEIRQHTPAFESTAIAQVDAFFTSEQMHYTETLTGQRQEPLSFIIIAVDDDALIRAFEGAQWYLADEVSIDSLLQIGRATFLKEPYLRAPMTPSFWNQKVHDFGFEKPTSLNNARQRHHARFWKTAYTTLDGEHIYVGTASFDDSVKWGITHKIDPDIDTERKVLFSDLQASGVVDSFVKLSFVKPVLGKNFAGDPFFTDGKIYHIKLKANVRQ